MKAKDLDPQLIENCAARGLTQKEAARELGVKHSAFVNACSRGLQGAWRRGRERLEAVRRAEELTSGLAGDDPRALVLKAVYAGIKNRREIRDATGLDYAKINDQLYHLELGGHIEKVETLRMTFYRRVGSGERSPQVLGHVAGVEHEGAKESKAA